MAKRAGKKTAAKKQAKPKKAAKKARPKKEEKAVKPLVSVHSPGMPAPPVWYLWLIIILNFIVPVINHFVMRQVEYAMYLVRIQNFIELFWIGTNLWVLWHLRQNKAQRVAYTLPVYYIGLFIVMLGLTAILVSSGLVQNTSLMYTIYMWLLVLTTAFELVAAAIFLKMRKEHAAR